eukprot:CAMPEP_0171068716 /NCGR_PEP_ID=MMETSP0766_2-20121228/8728_1 /TAXON_ID=439317 /ORGANISM="Gambierdiscus australes, Strain CAWD 149" /LENGTH=405 /DNA_ID=CAMNT_0011525059 /DNA_START=68 /DNA_END=1285 /DNA_ORIENTATION=-
MADDAKHLERLSSQVIAMFKAPTWVNPIANFVDENCLIFDDVEENKLEYTLVHKAFTQLVDELLVAHLSELSVTTEDFVTFCQRGLSGDNDVQRDLVEQLVSVEDFLIFKAMMVKRSAQLQRETLTEPGPAGLGFSELAAAGTGGCPPEGGERLDALRAEAERLEVERRCLEAELKLMTALSLQLEQRLQLTLALNELVEAVSKMEALAAEASAEASSEATAAAAVVAPPADACRTPHGLMTCASLPSSIHVQPLRAGGDVRDEGGDAEVKPAPRSVTNTPAHASGPSEAERQARTEHLKRQREALVAKKMRERQDQLSVFQQSKGSSAASRAAERAGSRFGAAGLQQPRSPDAESGKRLAAELSGVSNTTIPASQSPEAAAIQMRKTIARQLKQSLAESSSGHH